MLTHLLDFAFDSHARSLTVSPFASFMNSTVLTTVAATGFTVAFFHAALPTHWLPFVLVARAREWSRTKTLRSLCWLDLGHIGLTSLLGLAIAWFGFQLDEQLGGTFPWIAGGHTGADGFLLHLEANQWAGDLSPCRARRASPRE